MCIIASLEPKKTISKALLEAMYRGNSDGWGIMYAVDGKLHIAKDVSDFESFYATWRQVPVEAVRAIHFRIRTVGAISKANCHPFIPINNVAVMHNGGIDTHIVDAGMSDTHNYTKYELQPIMKVWQGWEKDEAFERLVKETTGGSRLLFMNSDGHVLHINRNSWIYSEGVLFSRSPPYNYNNSGRNSRNMRDYTDLRLFTHNTPKVSTPIVCSPIINRQPTLLLEQPKSDLSSPYAQDSNLTLVERQKRLMALSNAELQEEINECLKQDEDEAFAQAAMAAANRDLPEGDDPDEIEEFGENFETDIKELMAMDMPQLLEFIRDYPRGTYNVIKSLIGECVAAGILEMPEVTEDVAEPSRPVAKAN
jgi:predicted glutamine amidotransferase